jgi:hypothetical protein
MHTTSMYVKCKSTDSMPLFSPLRLCFFFPGFVHHNKRRSCIWKPPTGHSVSVDKNRSHGTWLVHRRDAKCTGLLHSKNQKQDKNPQISFTQLSLLLSRVRRMRQSRYLASSMSIITLCVIMMSWFSLDVIVCKQEDCQVGCIQKIINTRAKPHLFPKLTRIRTRTGPAYTQEVIKKSLKLNPRVLLSALADLATRVQDPQSQHLKGPQCFSVNSAGRDIPTRSILSFRPFLLALSPCRFPCLSLLLITI